MRIVLTGACALLFPFFSYAALNAGVINGVWLSNPSPEAGETVRIFTAVQNSSGETVTGTVAFLVNGDIVGTATFTITNNDVIPVSTEYTFEDGAHDISAYITSSDDSVAYTIAPDISVSVARKAPVTTEETKETANATTSLASITDTVTQKSRETLDSVQPIAERAAKRVETFRDSFVQATSTATNIEQETQDIKEVTDDEKKSEKSATKTFAADSKKIAQSEGVPIWKKAVGIALSLLALLLRFWFVLVVLIVGLVFWFMIRGRRIV